VPSDYYERIAAVERQHWWHVGMRSLTEVLLADRLAGHGQSLLDCGCGTGEFLRWIDRSGAFTRVVGSDIAAHAIELAKGFSPDFELDVAPLHDLPFGDGTFDVVTTNDVLQHVPEDLVTAALQECARVLRPGGTLLIRTNGARRSRRYSEDQRVYDRSLLTTELERAGLQVTRVTSAALVPSLWALARGDAPGPRKDRDDGIPEPAARRYSDRVAAATLTAERRWLARGHDIRFGHTLFAVARA
jgi:ubiquinone/menaquinone biosynthesis C-methylase UbiE